MIFLIYTDLLMFDIICVLFSPVQKANEANSNSSCHTNVLNSTMIPRARNKKWWIRLAIYSFLLLSGQAVATLLGRLYYEKGGKSIWMGSLVQLAGFPILLPYYFLSPHKKNVVVGYSSTRSNPPSKLVLASVYVGLGLMMAVDSYSYSVGLLYLPVSIYSLISVSQLAFNAFFSFFLNSHKFTPYIVNSLVLLTFSSVLLVFPDDDDAGSSKASKGNFVAGFIWTIVASALYGLVLSLTQFAIQNILKRETFSMVMDIIVYQSLVATLATLVGLFASREWMKLKKEMHMFSLGKDSYVMTLVWTIVAWQVYAIGAIGLVLEVSSLFSNVMSVFGLPLIPILAVFFFREKMDGLEVAAMLLAIWGFVSYVYQNYLDSHNSTTENQKTDGDSRASPEREINQWLNA
ncbi:Purine permease [Parasponia andersonii]|uniref:Probable purine permease n=1 Tax=Parasponia andersonii TaxID=3476 RepID=A0A2P5ATX3_PARAD|nr:Purine permease [Parasponia andersonii]